MERYKETMLALLLAGFFASVETSASERDQVPYSASVEVLGRSIVFGPQADFMIDERWCIGGGIAKVTASGPKGAEPPATALIPLYANYYFSPFGSSWFLTGGLTVVTNPGAVEGLDAVLGSLRFSSFPLLPDLGAGYEIRQGNGFLFRVNLLVYVGQNIAPAQGFALGWAL